MPFTPFHFGPDALIGIPLRRRLDLPIFLLANVVIDLEPLTVMVLGLHYPLHGYLHTFLIGSAVCSAWGWACYPLRGVFGRWMAGCGLEYSTSRTRMALSGALGALFHVQLDSFLYSDMHPFYPFRANPFLALISSANIYRFCSACFLPAAILAIGIALKKSEKPRHRA
ncbi:MAG: hydrolase [Elusimicrobia bacterium]|nr:hydrolase [Elusimicrobiota bacterium]